MDGKLRTDPFQEAWICMKGVQKQGGLNRSPNIWYTARTSPQSSLGFTLPRLHGSGPDIPSSHLSKVWRPISLLPTGLSPLGKITRFSRALVVAHPANESIYVSTNFLW